MPELLAVDKAPTISKSTMVVTNFKGIDLTTSPNDISEARSPDAINMIPDNNGNPTKRPGFSLIRNYEGRINGHWKINEHDVIHAGTNLYIDGAHTYSGMADRLSTGQIIKDKLYIFDGECALVCDGEDAYELFYDAYIPTVLISKNADFYTEGGETKTQEPGGSKNEAFNLISDTWRESFLCPTGTETTFTLSENKLSKKTVTAKVQNSSGVWQDKIEGTDFTVDRVNGKVVFSTAVPAAPVTGEDNVIITVSKHFDGYQEKIDRCRISISYGESGLSDRIFITGNPCEPNIDRWCAVNDPTYWPDTYYSTLGNNDTKIIGYSILEGQLATHLAPGNDGRTVLLRKSYLDDAGFVSFPVSGFMQGEEAISPYSFVYMETEPLFLTKRGVYAITPADIDGREYTQNRSYFINKVLTKEANLDKAVCGRWKNFYIISVNGKMFLLDISQKSYEANAPLSSFQYECYEWSGIDARLFWEEGEALYFGDNNGNLLRFATDFLAASSYEDWTPTGNKAINAYWTIPDFSGKLFWRNKTIRTIGLQLAAYPQNEVRVEKCVLGQWELLKEWSSGLSYFAWNAIRWSEFTYSGNPFYRTVTAKVKIKKFDRVGFRIVCDKMDKAFGLYGFSVEYTESGRYKK